MGNYKSHINESNKIYNLLINSKKSLNITNNNNAYRFRVNSLGYIPSKSLTYLKKKINCHKDRYKYIILIRKIFKINNDFNLFLCTKKLIMSYLLFLDINEQLFFFPDNISLSVYNSPETDIRTFDIALFKTHYKSKYEYKIEIIHDSDLGYDNIKHFFF